MCMEKIYGYQDYETPEIIAFIFYYDKEYRESTAERVLEILEKHEMFTPARMWLDHLTGGRMRKYTPDMRELFAKAYADPDVQSLEWENGMLKQTKEHIYFRWAVPFRKFNQQKESDDKIWNTIYFSMTYDWMKDLERQKHLMECVRDLSYEVGALFTKVDDIANGLKLLGRTQRYATTYIQQIYWGNYIGQHLLSDIRLKKLRKMNLPYYQETGDGVFFALTENALDFDSKACKVQRRKIRRLVKKRILRRILQK